MTFGATFEKLKKTRACPLNGTHDLLKNFSPKVARANHETNCVSRPFCETFSDSFSEVSLRLSLE